MGTAGAVPGGGGGGGSGSCSPALARLPARLGRRCCQLRPRLLEPPSAESPPAAAAPAQPPSAPRRGADIRKPPPSPPICWRHPLAAGIAGRNEVQRGAWPNEHGRQQRGDGDEPSASLLLPEAELEAAAATPEGPGGPPLSQPV